LILMRWWVNACLNSSIVYSHTAGNGNFWRFG
jgi:hypothetical protein